MGLELVEKDDIRSHLRLIVGSRSEPSERFQLAATVLSRILGGCSVYISHFLDGKSVALGQSLCGASQAVLVNQSLKNLGQIKSGGHLKVDVTKVDRDIVVGFNIFTSGRVMPAGCFVVVFNACDFVSGSSRRILLEAIDFLSDELKHNYFDKR